MLRATSLFTAVRSVARVAPRQARLFSVHSALKDAVKVAPKDAHDTHVATEVLSEGPFGPGGKVGEVPSDLDQSTGLERFELLLKLQGEDAFSVEPLQVLRMGSLTEPIKVFSLDNTRIIGCTGFPVDSHDTILFTINKEKPVRCPECGCAFKVDYQGLPGDHSHGHH